jgi:hypothetical protein
MQLDRDVEWDDPDAPPSVTRHASTLVDWSTFWQREGGAGDFLVDPVLARGRGHALYAPAKTGKSLFGLFVAAALATGRHVLNQPSGPPVDVVVFDLEMTEDDVFERLGEMGYGPDVDMSHLHYYVLPSLWPLDGALGGEEACEIARYHEAQAVIVDTAARAVAGKENDADTMRAFYAHTGRHLKAEGRALLRIDHAGKDLDRGQRGSSAKADDVDVVWRMTARDGGRYRLDATHRRMDWIPPSVELQQHTDPLRFLPADDSWPAGTKELAERLDLAGVPVGAGRPTARQMLKDAHLDGGRNDLLAAALRYRKTCPRPLGDSGTATQGTATRDSHHATPLDLGGQ